MGVSIFGTFNPATRAGYVRTLKTPNFSEHTRGSGFEHWRGFPGDGCEKSGFTPGVYEGLLFRSKVFGLVGFPGIKPGLERRHCLETCPHRFLLSATFHQGGAKDDRIPKGF